MIAVANFIGLPLLFLSSTLIAADADAALDADGWRSSTRSTGASCALAEAIVPGTDWSSRRRAHLARCSLGARPR